MRIRNIAFAAAGTTEEIDFDLINIRGHAVSWSVFYKTTSGTHSTTVEVSPDGTNWYTLGSAITTTSIVAQTTKAFRVRFVVTGTNPVGSIQVVW